MINAWRDFLLGKEKDQCGQLVRAWQSLAKEEGRSRGGDSFSREAVPAQRALFPRADAVSAVLLRATWVTCLTLIATLPARLQTRKHRLREVPRLTEITQLRNKEHGFHLVCLTPWLTLLLATSVHSSHWLPCSCCFRWPGPTLSVLFSVPHREFVKGRWTHLRPMGKTHSRSAEPPRHGGGHHPGEPHFSGCRGRGGLTWTLPRELWALVIRFPHLQFQEEEYWLCSEER